mmetsp:Transcript_25838/g.81948  ORF Transcript_25838/g.81948 Transcript_25838/m.81948 type:complete len:268 (+) Transcript_25838:793-1596(+)
MVPRAKRKGGAVAGAVRHPDVRLPRDPAQRRRLRRDLGGGDGGARRPRQLHPPLPELDLQDAQGRRALLHAGGWVAQGVQLAGRAVGALHVKVHLPRRGRVHAALLVHAAAGEGGLRGALGREHRPPLLAHAQGVVRQLSKEQVQARDPAVSRAAAPAVGHLPRLVGGRRRPRLRHLLPDRLAQEPLLLPARQLLLRPDCAPDWAARLSRRCRRRRARVSAPAGQNSCGRWPAASSDTRPRDARGFRAPVYRPAARMRSVRQELRLI